MKLLEAFEDAAHVTIRIVDRSHGLFHRGQCVLGQLDDFGGMAFLQKFLDRIDPFPDALRVAVHLAVPHELARIDRVVDGLAVGGEVEAPRVGARRAPSSTWRICSGVF